VNQYLLNMDTIPTLRPLKYLNITQLQNVLRILSVLSSKLTHVSAMIRVSKLVRKQPIKQTNSCLIFLLVLTIETNSLEKYLMISLQKTKVETMISNQRLKTRGKRNKRKKSSRSKLKLWRLLLQKLVKVVLYQLDQKLIHHLILLNRNRQQSWGRMLRNGCADNKKNRKSKGNKQNFVFNWNRV